MTAEPFADTVPGGDERTPYDLAHLATYLRLLDAAADRTASWAEAVEIIFGIDPAAEPERARCIYDGHLARATWMAREGHSQLTELHRRSLD